MRREGFGGNGVPWSLSRSLVCEEGEALPLSQLLGRGTTLIKKVISLGDTQLGESELPEPPTSIDSTEMDESTATTTTSIDEADTELQSRTLKGRRRPGIAHLPRFIRAGCFLLPT